MLVEPVTHTQLDHHGRILRIDKVPQYPAVQTVGPVPDSEDVFLHRPVGVGDVLFMEPALRALRALNPERIIGLSSCFPELALMMGVDKAPRFVRGTKFPAGYRNVHHAVETHSAWHAWDRVTMWEDLVGVPLSEHPPALPQPATTGDLAALPGYDSDKRTLGFMPAAVEKDRTLPPPVWQAAAQALSEEYNVVVWRRPQGFPGCVTPPIGDVPSWISQVAQCDLALAVDTGGQYVALALGLPTLGIFEHVAPHLRMRRWKDNALAWYLRRPECDCPAHGRCTRPAEDCHQVAPDVFVRAVRMLAEGRRGMMGPDLTEYPSVRLSVIIPHAGRHAQLLQTVASLRAALQGGMDSEIIVVHDGNGGYCPGADHEIHLGEQRGPAGARNAGLNKAVGEYVLFCDADMLPTRAAIWRAFAEIQPRIPAVARGGGRLVTREGKWNGFTPMGDGSGVNADTGGTGFLLVRRDDIGDLRFDESLRYHEDSDFTWKLTRKRGRQLKTLSLKVRHDGERVSYPGERARQRADKQQFLRQNDLIPKPAMVYARGAWGVGNIGDDAIAAALQQVYGEQLQLVLGKRKLAGWGGRRIGWDQVRAEITPEDTFLWGGGGLIWSNKMVTEARKFMASWKQYGCRLEIRGLGLEGEGRDSSELAALLGLADRVRLRSEWSVAHARSLGVEAEYEPDLAFALAGEVPKVARDIPLLIVPRIDGPLDPQGIEAAVADWLSRYPGAVMATHVPKHEAKRLSELPVWKRIAQRVGIRVMPLGSWQDALALYARAERVATMRWHGLVFAAMCGSIGEPMEDSIKLQAFKAPKGEGYSWVDAASH